ncbi:MAG: hypothetical protein O9341_04500 [Paucibacter sp.]|nr:hypothetical protein [Roseateles sp.]
MRLQWSRAELAALLRRWAAFLAVVAAVLGSFISTLIGWPALPLFWAMQADTVSALSLAALLGHALPGLLLAWGLREALLPARWMPFERALPLRRADLVRADLGVLALALLPWALLNLISFAAWRAARPAWMQGLWLQALLGFAFSLLLSAGGALALMQWRRRSGRPARRAAAAGKATGRQTVSTWTALLCLPLWRGPARPVLHGLLAALLALLLCLAAAWHFPVHAAWALAFSTLLTQGFCARLQAQARQCYAPLQAASAMLPVSPQAWSLRLYALALLPALLAWLSWAVLLAQGPWSLGPRAMPAFFVAAVAAPALALWRPENLSPEARAGRWLLSWGIWVALASEVIV